MEVNKIKIIPFDGKRENWNMWSRKFLCKLTVYVYRDILLKDDEVKEDLPETPASDHESSTIPIAEDHQFTRARRTRRPPLRYLHIPWGSIRIPLTTIASFAVICDRIQSAMISWSHSFEQSRQ